MMFKIMLLLMTVLISLYTDLKENKIKNKYLIVSIILGLFISVLTGGMNSFFDSILGMIVPFLILIIFFAMRMFGAGDIKLFCTIGAIMGSNFAINNMIFSFLVAGIFIIFKLIITGKLFRVIVRVYKFFKAIVITGSVLEFNSEENKFPFAIAIFLGTILQLILKYNFI